MRRDRHQVEDDNYARGHIICGRLGSHLEYIIQIQMKIDHLNRNRTGTGLKISTK